MKSASIRSLSSGARICKKETAPYLLPMRKNRPSPNRKEDGAIKSLTDRPLSGSQSHSKLNRSPSGWKMPCSSASRCFPSSVRAAAPKTLKWLRASVSIRASRARAVLMFSAFIKKSKTREITIVYNFIGAFDFTRAIDNAQNTIKQQQKTA